MFSTLKQGDALYVIEQQDHLVVRQGAITNISPTFNGGLDVKVKIDDQEYQFQQLPFNQVSAKYGQTTVVDSKDSLVSEVTKLKEHSDNILNNLPYHKQMSKDCDSILRRMNPSYDKEQKRDEEIQLMKEQMSVMAQSITNIEQLLKK